MLELLTGSPAEFCRAAVPVLEAPSGPGHKVLAGMVVTDGLALKLLSDPKAMPLAEAHALAKAASRAEPLLDVKLLRCVWSENGPTDTALLQWLLGVLEGFSDGSHILPLLMQLLRHPDEAVRSKATYLIGRSKKDLRWIEQYLHDQDPRVRANAVQAAWGDASPRALTFFQAAARDPHHRVAANALVGLHQAGYRDAAAMVEQMAASPQPLFRCAAAWAMGHLGDPAFAPPLKTLSKDAAGEVRRAALAALVRMNKAPSAG